MWAQIVSAGLGIWLLAAPPLLGYTGAAQTNDRIVGPIAAAFATTAIWGVTRSLRLVNLPLGAWLLFAPWLLGYATAPTVNSSVVGVLLIGLALVRGTVEERFGGGWATLRPSHAAFEDRAGGDAVGSPK